MIFVCTSSKLNNMAENRGHLSKKEAGEKKKPNLSVHLDRPQISVSSIRRGKGKQTKKSGSLKMLINKNEWDTKLKMHFLPQKTLITHTLKSYLFVNLS